MKTVFFRSHSPASRYKIAPGKGGLTAVITSSGFQTDETLLCDAKVEGNRVELLFKSYPNGHTVNEYEVERYKKGARMLTLEISKLNGKTRILTYWGAFTPNDEHAKSGRVYFKKIT